MDGTIICFKCSGRLRVPDGWAGGLIRCPRCKSVRRVAAAEADSIAPQSSEEPAAQDQCPECGAGMTPEAVLCLDCGFNRETGKRVKTVKQRVRRQWDSGDFPFVARLIVFVVVLPAGALPALYGRPELAVFTSFLWAVILLLVLGSLKRIILTRQSDGRAVLIRRWWVCFLPTRTVVTHLDRYSHMRTGAVVAGMDGTAVFVAIGLFLLFGLPGIIYLVSARTKEASAVTLQLVGDHGDPDVAPVLVYRGSSDEQMRTIGDAIKELSGLRYG